MTTLASSIVAPNVAWFRNWNASLIVTGGGGGGGGGGEAPPPDDAPYEAPRLVTLRVGDEYLSFSIDPEYLEQGEAFFQEIMTDAEEPMEFDEQVRHVNYRFDLHRTSNIICHMLAADPETADLIGVVLSEYPELEAERLLHARQREWEAQQAVMGNHKDVLVAMFAIEELMDELRQNFTIVIATHSMQQAARVSQKTAFFHLGILVEEGSTEQMFTNPRDDRTQAYITGRIG